jgi:hypothetical protein
MGSFIASPPIERRHTRQWIAEKPSRQIARLKLGSAITIRQRQGTGPNARREHKVSGLAAVSSFVQDFGHCSFPPYGLPKPQPYGTPAPWPNGDGRLSELGPNTGISMKNAPISPTRSISRPMLVRICLGMRAATRWPTPVTTPEHCRRGSGTKHSAHGALQAAVGCKEPERRIRR